MIMERIKELSIYQKKYERKLEIERTAELFGRENVF